MNKYERKVTVMEKRFHVMSSSSCQSFLVLGKAAMSSLKNCVVSTPIQVTMYTYHRYEEYIAKI